MRNSRRLMAVTKRKNFDPPTVHFSSLLFICALMPALLFKGPQIEFFAVTQIILVLWMGWIALRSYDKGFILPKTALALCLTLFWLWLAISLFWSLAPNISVINFWWVGSLALVFWLYTLTPDRDALWQHAAAILLVLGLVLALMGIYQAQVYEQQARSIFETRNTHAAFLNLVTLPASAYFLLFLSNNEKPRVQLIFLGVILYVLFFAIFLTASRGATLSFFIGMLILLALSARHVSRRGMAWLIVLMAVAFLSTKISHGELEARLPQLMQDSGRLTIWESSWHLRQASPWYGIGLGLFYLAYPPYRNPLDNSGGFFAHNDYLQVWIEIGLPGLLLLLTILLAVAWLLLKVLRANTMQKAAHIEIVGLFCGLFAVAAHSVVDFNLYILSIMMIAGLMLGRFHELVTHHSKISWIRLHPSRVIGKRAYPLIIVLLFLFPLFYFVALGMANSYYDKGMMQAREGKIQEADQSLTTAQRLTPSDDRMLIAHADLYRHAITLLSSDKLQSKKALYDNALDFLDQAQHVNVLRGLTYIIRGRLYQQNMDLAGEKGYVLATASFQRALALNPKLFQGRLDYANLLLQHGNKDEALRVLEDGAQYQYYETYDMVPFYSLTAKLRREAGKVAEAKILEEKIQYIEKQANTRYYLRGY